MSLRKWAFTLCALFLLGSILVFASKDYLHGNERLKSLILNEAKNTFFEKLDLGKLESGFGYVAVDDVALPLNDGSDSLSISEIRLGWSLFELLKAGLTPTKGITSITLESPMIFIGSRKDEKDFLEDEVAFSIKRDQIIESFESTYSEILRNFKSISRIDILHGLVAYKKKNGEIITIGKNINGKLISADKKKAFLQLSAKLLESDEENLQVNADLDLEKYSIVADISIEALDIPSSLPDLVSKYVDITKGELNGQFQFIKDANSQGKYNFFINGHYDVRNLVYSMSIAGHKLSFLNSQITGIIQENTLTLDTFVQEIAGGFVSSKGKLLNPFDPEFDLRIDLVGLELSEFQQDSFFVVPQPVSGKLTGEIFLRGPLTKPILNGIINADTINIGTFPLHDFSSNIELDYPSLIFSRVAASSKQIELDLNAYIDVSNPDSLNINGAIAGNFLSLFSNIKVPVNNEYSGIVEFDVNGPMRDLTAGGNLNLTSRNDKGDLVFDGNFTYKENNFFIESGQETNRETLNFNGTFNDDFSLFDLTLDNAFLFLEHDLNIPVKRLFGSDTELYLGFKQAIDSETEILLTVLNASERNMLSIRGVLDREREGVINSEILIPIKDKPEIKFDADLSRSSGRFSIENIVSPGLLSGNAYFIDDGSITLHGDLYVNTTVSKLREFSSFSLFEQGNFEGNIKIAGNPRSPQIVSAISLTNGTMKELKNLTGEGTARSTGWTDFIIEQVSLYDQGALIALGAGEYNAKKNNIELNIFGQKIDLVNANKLFLGGMELLKGDASYNVRYIRENGTSKLSGTVEAEKGMFDRFPFEDFKMTLTDNTPEELAEQIKRGFTPAGMNIKSMSLVSSRGLNITGDGYLTFYNEIPSDFNLNFAGDILSIFLDVDDEFIETSSSGIVKMNLSGSIQNPVVSKGSIDIDDGFMKVSSVVDEVEDLSFHAVLLPETKFIEVETFEALLDGKKVSIKNHASVSLENYENPELIPIDLMDDGLNIGILSFHTGPEGVSLNIPGFIEEGETGTMKVMGRNPEEYFYLAGPLDNPFAIGIGELSDSRVIYPELLEEGEEIKLNIVERFLERTIWDVQVKSKSNNMYVRREPMSDEKWLTTFGGYVYMKLKIDDEDEGLFVKGSVLETDDVPFGISGDLYASRGTVEFFDLAFKLQGAEALFYENQLYPTVKGSAKITKRDPKRGDGNPMDVLITLYSFDEDGNKINQGTWIDEEPNFFYSMEVGQNLSDFSTVTVSQQNNQTVSGEENLYTNEMILAILGYSPDNVSTKAAELAVGRTADAILTPVLTPINRYLKKTLGLDDFRIRASIANNFQQQYYDPALFQEQGSLSDLYLAPELSFGKYLMNDLYFSYSGQLVRILNEENSMGLNHIFGFEYQLRNKLFIELQYDYDFYRYYNDAQRGDTRFWLRHQIQLRGIKNNN